MDKLQTDVKSSELADKMVISCLDLIAHYYFIAKDYCSRNNITKISGIVVYGEFHDLHTALLTLKQFKKDVVDKNYIRWMASHYFITSENNNLLIPLLTFINAFDCDCNFNFLETIKF